GCGHRRHRPHAVLGGCGQRDHLGDGPAGAGRAADRRRGGGHFSAGALLLGPPRPFAQAPVGEPGAVATGAGEPGALATRGAALARTSVLRSLTLPARQPAQRSSPRNRVTSAATRSGRVTEVRWPPGSSTCCEQAIPAASSSRFCGDTTTSRLPVMTRAGTRT